ncbi:hypothetical protein A9Q81_21100 [Gammaproteobacteria bacterium 42_54_T18]|nr:hypothetical protein A9Q81_21100 [Gammaproteobacteria bacterium 42_54_T18]
MLFAFVLAVFTVAGWAMTPKLRKLTANHALGWMFHCLGIAGVYMLAALVMLYSDISVATLSYYYGCLIVVGGATVIILGSKIYLNRKVEAKRFGVAAQ